MSVNVFRAGLALGALCVGFCTVGAANAADGDPDGTGFAVGAQLGTTGAGVSAQLGISPLIALRASGDYLAISHGATYSGIPYRGHWKGTTGGAFVDLHPFSNPFVVSGGAYIGGRRLRIDATPQNPVTVGGILYTPAEVGQLNGDIRLSQFTPFAGLGFNNTFRTSGHWSIIAMAGVAFSQRPAVTLSATGGSLSALPAFQASVIAEQAKISQSVRNYRYYPVATLGVAYHF